jgi:colanic acid/amylovoran biosynthesis glycosyltransferase
MAPTLPLRVAYLINQYPAGSHTFIRREIEALERQGVAVQRVSIRGWDAKHVDAVDQREQTLTQYLLQRGAPALAAALLRTALRSPTALWRAVQIARRLARQSERPLPVHLVYLAEACLLLEWLRAGGATHLHAHFATNPAEIALLTRTLGGPPYSFTAHGSDIMDRPAQVGLAETVGGAAFVAAVCWFGRSQILKWTPQRLWGRVEVVRCGLQPGYGHDTAPVSKAARRLLCIGRLSHEKGQLLLLEAARQLADRGVDFTLVLAGDGPLRAEVEAEIARAGLGDRVHITGWLDAAAVQREIAISTALVVASLSEGLPVVIMEAMACGRPVVAPYLSGIPELVTGATGWLFAAGDTGGLVDALEHCLAADEITLQAMGRDAQAAVWAAHDVDREAARLVQLITGATPPRD